MKLTTDQLHFYAENGYVVVPHIFSTTEIGELSGITAMLADEAKSFESKGVDNQFEGLRGSQVVLSVRPDQGIAIKRLVWAGAAAPDLLNRGRDSRLLDLVSQILEDTEADHLINQIHYKEPHDGVSFPWHQDEQNRRKFDPQWQDCGKNGSFVQVITAIDACNKDNGPLLVIPGSHKWGYLEFGEFLNTQDLQTRFMDQKQLKVADVQMPLFMQPGDTVLMHPRLIHGSWPNESNEFRRILINGFSSPGANNRQYPGTGSAKRISLINGNEIDLGLRTSAQVLIDLRTRNERNTAKISDTAAVRLTATFH